MGELLRFSNKKNLAEQNPYLFKAMCLFIEKEIFTKKEVVDFWRCISKAFIPYADKAMVKRAFFYFKSPDYQNFLRQFIRDTDNDPGASTLVVGLLLHDLILVSQEDSGKIDTARMEYLQRLQAFVAGIFWEYEKTRQEAKRAV